jgi:hypothetical protein
MKIIATLIALGSLASVSAASAHDTTTPFPSRGACESASAGMSNAEKDWLLVAFPDLFDTAGEAASFLTRAWTCDLNQSDGQWYIVNHVDEVLGSEWFQRRNQ